MKIGIITETTADFPAGLAEKKNIILIPIHIVINGESKLHGVDVVNQEVVEYLNQKDDVNTKPTTPREYCSYFEQAIPEYDYIYSMHVSNEASQCFENSKHGLKLFKKKQKKGDKGAASPSNIKIIDTRQASICQAQIINRVANVIKTEKDLAKIEKYIKWLISKSMMFFVVDDLYWLKKAGRMNAITGFFGKLFDIKPVIKMEDGVFKPVAKPKGKDAALDVMIEKIIEDTPKYRRGVEVWIAHCGALLDAKYVKKKLAEGFKIEPKKIAIIEAGPTITVHTGPGAVCVSVLPK